MVAAKSDAKARRSREGWASLLAMAGGSVFAVGTLVAIAAVMVVIVAVGVCAGATGTRRRAPAVVSAPLPAEAPIPVETPHD